MTINLTNIKFGRHEPKERERETVWSIRKLAIPTPKKVDVTLTLPSYRSIYNQKYTNACTGFSGAWSQTINNKLLYDAAWLYNQGQLNDNDPETTPQADNGGYVWAVFWAMQHLGLKKIGRSEKPHLPDGTLSYYWGTSHDDARAALSIKRPFVVGTVWYEEFMTPIKRDGAYWIGTSKDLGKMLGGHAYCIYGCHDTGEYVEIVNSWGLQYPLVRMSYSTFDKVLSQGGEMCISIDNPKAT